MGTLFNIVEKSCVLLITNSFFVNVTPTFAKVRVLFPTIRDKQHVERKIIKKQLSDHHNNLQCLRIKHLELSSNLLQLVPKVVFRILLRNISNSLRISNMQQLQTKNKKIHKLKPEEQHIPYQVPIINLTDYDIDSSCLKYGLHHSFIDKNRFINRDLGVELESLAASVDEFVSPEVKEEFHQFLRNTTYTLTNNVYHTKDDTYNKTKSLRDNKNIVILSGDKDSSIVIMNKIDYDKKVEQMINEGIEQGKYEETEDNILKELESFQSFLYRHFKDTPYYKQMLPSSHQPARFFALAKTHKFDNLSDINVTNLKLRPIIDQTGTCYYKTGKVISKYLIYSKYSMLTIDEE